MPRRPGLPAHLRTALVAARTRRGWSLADAATATGLSRGYLSRIETGARPPTRPTALTLADAYQLDQQHRDALQATATVAHTAPRRAPAGRIDAPALIDAGVRPLAPAARLVPAADVEYWSSVFDGVQSL